MDRRAANAERLAEIRRRFIDRCVPLTPAEEAEHESLIAREMHRAECRRNPQPAADLLTESRPSHTGLITGGQPEPDGLRDAGSAQACRSAP
jgi:hypothetical protein